VRFKKNLFFVFSFLVVSVSAQNKLSHQLLEKRFTKDLTVLSISVKDTVVFQKKYKSSVNILHRQRNSNCFLITGFNEAAFDQLKADSNILFIDHHNKPVVEAGVDYVFPSFNRIAEAKKWFAVKGDNRKVSIKEEGFDPTDINLVGRTFTTSASPSITSQHATTMAILIAGAGNSSPKTEGAAPKALCTSSDFNNLFPDASTLFTSNNIHVQNHSYGVGIENYYGNEAYAYDQQVSQNPTLTHVFSVGNLGNSKPTSGTYQNLNFANLSGNFKQAKNVLLVNAVDTTLTINTVNSRGPAFDGRLKPELTAFGQGGTSESAALVSGISLLVQEKFENINLAIPDRKNLRTSTWLYQMLR
jgi:hypothetical protein